MTTNIEQIKHDLHCQLSNDGELPTGTVMTPALPLNMSGAALLANRFV